MVAHLLPTPVQSTATIPGLPEVVDIKAAAAHIGVSERHVARLIELGELPAYRVSERVVRIRVDDLVEFLDHRYTGGKS